MAVYGSGVGNVQDELEHLVISENTETLERLLCSCHTSTEASLELFSQSTDGL